MTFPFKRSGAYQLRAAVRDAASSRVGSAYQFVELPDVRDGAFALSGVTFATEGARRFKAGDRELRGRIFGQLLTIGEGERAVLCERADQRADRRDGEA